MFNLDTAITEWRRQMLEAGIKTPVPLEEVEIHLREEIERQLKSGLSEQEIFDSAVQKIGSAHTIQYEFEKVEKAAEDRQWKEGQIWLGAILGLLQLIVIGSVLFNSDMRFGQRMSGLAAIATSFLLLAVVGRLGHQAFPVIRARRVRIVIIFLSGVLLGAIWFWVFGRFLLPGDDFGQYLATLLWVNCPPLGVFTGLIWGIEIAARKEVATIVS